MTEKLIEKCIYLAVRERQLDLEMDSLKEEQEKVADEFLNILTEDKQKTIEHLNEFEIEIHRAHNLDSTSIPPRIPFLVDVTRYYGTEKAIRVGFSWFQSSGSNKMEKTNQRSEVAE